MNLVKPKFVTVQPKSSTAKDHFFNFMNELHSCKVKEENRENKRAKQELNKEYKY